MSASGNYRGRLAPSPTGYLHLGHARTFWFAQQRARAAHGTLILRNEDLDAARTRPEFAQAMLEDLRWCGFIWEEGPDVGGPFAPYDQSARTALYRAALEQLRRDGFIYPCSCSRRDIQQAAQAPHAGDDELIYPGTCRPASLFDESASASTRLRAQQDGLTEQDRITHALQPDDVAAPEDGRTPAGATTGNQPTTRVSWRFRVPDGETISFHDGRLGAQSFVAGQDFGDFVVWRPDDVPAYQLAVVVDDAAMQITEVVRGADLLVSTARQLLLYRALKLTAPKFFHCPLVLDDNGQRLAKRHESLSLRALRAAGKGPEKILGSFSTSMV